MNRVALVVDDSALIRNEIRRFLQKVGFRVVTAANGLEGLARIEEVAPELVVAGLMVPRLNGGDFIREVRHRCGKREVTIVSIAGIRGRNVPSPRAGADHVIFKGVDLVEQLQLALGCMKESGIGKLQSRTTQRSRPVD